MYVVKYKHKGNDAIHEATFDNAIDARLWWDTICYIRLEYQLPLTPRP